MTRITSQAPSFTTLPPRVGERRRDRLSHEAPPQLQTVLFGATLPPALDVARFPHLAEQMRWLLKQKTKLAVFAGDHDDDYAVALCEGFNACIGPDGMIYLGERLLATGDEGLILGVLAHEVGHRPKTWFTIATTQREDLLAIARDEEAKADRFAGRALAELGLSPEPICDLRLHGHFEKQPENYYPAAVRAVMIRAAHAAQGERIRAARKLFPGFLRASNVKDLIDLGE